MSLCQSRQRARIYALEEAKLGGKTDRLLDEQPVDDGRLF